MRKSGFVNITHAAKTSQQGFSLFIVLMVMMVMAFLVVTVTQSYNTEQRISTNDADRKLAMSLAEAALREGEKAISDFGSNTQQFSKDCDNGLCSAAGSVGSADSKRITTTDGGDTVAWERREDDNNDKPLLIDTKGREYSSAGALGVRTAPRYIIEYIGTNDEGGDIYRVTAKAWGKNNNTVVMVQSYAAIE